MIDIRHKIQGDLLDARRAGASVPVKALQSLLARITHAEAVTIDSTNRADASIHNIGVGSTELPRQELSQHDVLAIIQDEVDELQKAIADMSGQPNHPYVLELKQKLAVIASYLH